MLIQLGVSLRVPEPLDIRKAAERLNGYYVKMTLDRVIPLVLFNPNFHKGFVGCGRVVYVDVLRQPRSNSLYRKLAVKPRHSWRGYKA